MMFLYESNLFVKLVYIILQYNNQTDNEMKPETVNRYRNHTHVQ